MNATISEKGEIETHPFKAFIPKSATVLIIGSFPGRAGTLSEDKANHWFYSAKRNQFWKIISAVYGKELATKAAKQDLFETAGIAITDIFLKISRKNNSNLDQNLVIEEYNDKAIREALTNSKIMSVFFTSKFVEKHFRLKFPEIDFAESLPSPSPRFAWMSLEAKIVHYKAKLPKL